MFRHTLTKALLAALLLALAGCGGNSAADSGGGSGSDARLPGEKPGKNAMDDPCSLLDLTVTAPVAGPLKTRQIPTGEMSGELIASCIAESDDPGAGLFTAIVYEHDDDADAAAEYADYRVLQKPRKKDMYGSFTEVTEPLGKNSVLKAQFYAGAEDWICAGSFVTGKTMITITGNGRDADCREAVTTLLKAAAA